MLDSQEEKGQPSTTLRLTDSIIGHIHDSLLQSLDEGWRQLYGEGGLKSFAEKRR